MRHRFLFGLFACGLLLVALSACNDDPTGVGLGVGPQGFRGGTPVNVDLEPTTFEAVSINDVTGNSVRILTGSVNDPALGTINTTGYIDVTPPSSLPDGFEGSTVQAAELVLTPSGEFTDLQGGQVSIPPYVYGDTLTAMTVGVYAMPNEWEASTSDETLSAGTLIAESDPFMPGDTVRIDLPSSNWSGFSTLSDTSGFESDFHGFQVRAMSGDAVVGFARPSTTLQVTANDETVEYPASRSFTSIARPDLPSFPDQLLVQDGIGRALSFKFTFPDSLSDVPISRAVLRLPTDTTLFDTATLPNGFVRPRTSDLVIQGIGADSTLQLAASNSLNTRGAFTFEATQDGPSLRQIFQSIALGESSVERYQVSLSQSNNTINSLLFYAPGTGENAPRVSLTIAQPDD